MTQNEAIAHIRKMIGRHPGDAATCTGDAKTCNNYECMICAVRDCPHNEPFHYHHDGCPACWQDEEESK